MFDINVTESQKFKKKLKIVQLLWLGQQQQFIMAHHSSSLHSGVDGLLSYVEAKLTECKFSIPFFSLALILCTIFFSLSLFSYILFLLIYIFSCTILFSFS